MGKYNWNDLIVNPSSDKAKFCLGKEVYFSDVPTSCLEYANSDRRVNLGRLEDIKSNLDFPFTIIKGGSRLTSTSIILKREDLESKYVPFKDKQEFIKAFEENTAKMKPYGIWVYEVGEYSENILKLVLEIQDDGLVIGSSERKISWENLAKLFIFENGTPCGKLKEEEVI